MNIFKRDLSGHKSYIDILRIIAIFMVYYVHTGTRAMHHYQIEGGPISYYAALFLNTLALAGPPIFFAISGGLLLSRDIDLKKLLTRRIPKYILIILIFNLLQLYYKAIASPEMLQNPFLDLLKMIYGYTLIAQYWFLNAYLVFLCLLPVLAAAAKNMSRKAFEYLIGLFLVIEFALQILEYFVETERIALNFGPWDSILIAPFVGFYIEKYFKDLASDRIKLLIINFAALIAVICNVRYMDVLYKNELPSAYLGGTVILIVMAVYTDIKLLLDERINKKHTATIFKILGDGVFLAYLIEIQMKDLYIGFYDKTVNTISWLGATVLWLIPGILTAILIRFVLSLIPGVRKIIP